MRRDFFKLAAEVPQPSTLNGHLERKSMYVITELTNFLVGVLLKLESVLQSKPLLWHLEHGAGNVSAESHLD